VEVSFWGRQGSYVGWSICSGGGVEVVAIGSDCWVGCGGSYELGCRSSLALVNEDGKAGGACANGACAGGACIGGACTNGACGGGACVDGACMDGAFIDGACADGACTGGGCIDGGCIGGAVVVAGVGRLGRGSSFEACGLIAFS
jgi:hypothetical protein